MDCFVRQSGVLHAEQLALTELANQVGTPAYVYSQKALVAQSSQLLRALAGYPSLACFAVKANSNLSVLRELFQQGLGADLVSVGELERALLAGALPEKMVFSGVGKRDEEISRALSVGIYAFNVESPEELLRIGVLAERQGRVARVCLRVNPNIEARTNAKIATGMYTTKFGMPEADLPGLVGIIRRHPALSLLGLACHIGSQLVDLAPIQEAGRRLAELSKQIIADGLPLEVLDLGGGLGIRYDQETPPSLEEYAAAIIDAVRPTGLKAVIEPGRSMVGNAGVVLTRVITVKRTPKKTFVVLDAAMNDLLRPTLYEAFHAIEPVGPVPLDAKICECDFVGPICESGDYLGRSRMVAVPREGDLFVIRGAGAYGASMASHYNTRPMAVEVMVSDKHWRVVRPRETLAELWASEMAAL